jgi:hypothetical protein
MFNNILNDILIQYWKPKGVLVNLKSHLITLFIAAMIGLFSLIILSVFTPFSFITLFLVYIVMILNHIIFSIWSRFKFGDNKPENLTNLS